MRWIIAAALIATCDFASAAQTPRGYAPATIYAETPEGRHAIEAYIPRRFCGLVVPALVDRDGTLSKARAGAVCTR